MKKPTIEDGPGRDANKDPQRYAVIDRSWRHPEEEDFELPIQNEMEDRLVLEEEFASDAGIGWSWWDPEPMSWENFSLPINHELEAMYRRSRREHVPVLVNIREELYQVDVTSFIMDKQDQSGFRTPVRRSPS